MFFCTLCNYVIFCNIYNLCLDLTRKQNLFNLTLFLVWWGFITSVQESLKLIQPLEKLQASIYGWNILLQLITAQLHVSIKIWIKLRRYWQTWERAFPTSGIRDWVKVFRLRKFSGLKQTAFSSFFFFFFLYLGRIYELPEWRE